MAHTTRDTLYDRIAHGRATMPGHAPSIALCPDCPSDAAAFADCRSLGDGRWAGLLRCGDCGRWWELVMQDAELAAVEDTLMAGWGAIARDLHALGQIDS